VRGTFNLILLVVFIILTYAYKDWHPGFASTFIFYVLVLICLYEALLCFTMFHRLQVERTIGKKRLFAGGSQEVFIRLKRKHRFPFAWYAACENGQAYVVFPWFRKEIEIHYRLQDLPRGYYDLTDIIIESGDLFGFVKRERIFNVLGSFTVYPQYQNLKNWTAKGGEKATRSSVISRTSTELKSLSGIRQYQYGDRLSQINWKASARTMNLKTKDFEFQVAGNFTIFLDTHCQAYMHPEQFEKALSLVASFIQLGHKRQLKYSLVSAGMNEKVDSMEGNLDVDFYRFLDYLAVIQPVAGRTLQQAAIPKLMNLARGTHLVFITGTIDHALALWLSELAHRKRIVELFLINNHKGETGEDWLKTLSRNGVICHCESA
jgi:uncharacterized protein (DUF58 family)